MYSNFHLLVVSEFKKLWRPLDFSETRAIEEAVLIKESSQLKTMLSGQKGTTNIVSNLNELIIVMGMTNLHQKKKKKKYELKDVFFCYHAASQYLCEDTTLEKILVHLTNFEFCRQFSCCITGVVHSLMDRVKTKLLHFQMRDIFLSLILLMSWKAS